MTIKTRLQSAATAVLTATAVSLSAQAAELDDTAAMLTGTIHFGGTGPTTQFQLQSVARSTRFDQTVPLAGLHWDNRTGLAPSVLGTPLTPAPAFNAADSEGGGSGWSWVGWTAAGLGATVWMLSQIELDFSGFFEGLFNCGSSDDNDDPDGGTDPGADDEEPCEPGPLSPVIGSGCR